MDSVHKKVLNEILRQNKPQQSSAEGTSIIIEKDKRVRKEVAELYQFLRKLDDPSVAINLLSDHVAIMVDMINEFKGAK